VSHSLRLALGFVGAAQAALAGVEVVLLLPSDAAPLWLLSSFAALALVYGGAGLVAWWRRPSNRTGLLLVATGAAWLAAGLANTLEPALVAVGTVVAVVPLAGVVHLLLSFPSGRLPSRASRAVVGAAYGLAVVGPAPAYLFTPASGPDDLLLVADRPDLAALSSPLQSIGGLTMVATAVLLARRLRRYPRSQRRVLLPLYAYGVLAALVVVLSARAEEVLGLPTLVRFAVQVAVVAGVPVAFAAVLLRGGFARTGEVEELGAWLGAAGTTRSTLVEAVARTLGDPSLELVFRLPDGDRLVHADGTPAELPLPGSGRAAVEVERAGDRLGAIVYDAALIADPELVRRAGRVVALAVESERLTARLRASEEALRRSRSRLVEAGDRERRRIAQDLHDGLQVRLVLLGLQAARLALDADGPAGCREGATALRTGLDAAAAELRDLVHAVMPAPLVERGLCAATEDLVDRVPVPTRLSLGVPDGVLPAPVQNTAYFVVAEGLANALKHARATQLSVRVAHEGHRLVVEVGDDGVGGADLDAGTGLRGLADRVDVLGGTLRVTSPDGAGTRLVAELPCAS
jgi:signal transduction histidine kinase